MTHQHLAAELATTPHCATCERALWIDERGQLLHWLEGQADAQALLASRHQPVRDVPRPPRGAALSDIRAWDRSQAAKALR